MARPGCPRAFPTRRGPDGPISAQSPIITGSRRSTMYDLAIVGGGTAGASAATFTGRAGLQTVVVDVDRGMTRRAMLNNHLGFPEGVTGPDLVDRGQQQAEKAGATWIKAEVTGLERKDD